jgi:biopolymer transport protein ExbB/TolQ
MLNRLLDRLLIAFLAVFVAVVGVVAFTVLFSVLVALAAALAAKLWWDSRRLNRTLEGDYQVLVESPPRQDASALIEEHPRAVRR